jgi:acyl-CoA synthetase (AMP-forming)/AMP-acid ligase II
MRSISSRRLAPASLLGVPGMAQVVEMDAGQADRGALSRSIREVKSHQRETVLEAQGYVRDEGAAAEGAAAEPDDIIAYCGKRLTACKYAREVRITADLPKGQTGKIFKRELRPE